MKRLFLMAGAGGVLLALTCLWGGAYALHLYANTWAGFPLFMTAVTLGFCGAWLAVCGFAHGLSGE